MNYNILTALGILGSLGGNSAQADLLYTFNPNLTRARRFGKCVAPDHATSQQEVRK
jgi:hypothetical protein